MVQETSPTDQGIRHQSIHGCHSNVNVRQLGLGQAQRKRIRFIRNGATHAEGAKRPVINEKADVTCFLRHRVEYMGNAAGHGEEGDRDQVDQHWESVRILHEVKVNGVSAEDPEVVDGR